jgi:hypothetical protein
MPPELAVAQGSRSKAGDFAIADTTGWPGNFDGEVVIFWLSSRMSFPINPPS